MTFDVLQRVNENHFTLHRPISDFCEKRSVVGRPVFLGLIFATKLGNIRLYSEVGGSRGEHEVTATPGHVTPPLPVRFGGAVGRSSLSWAVRCSKGSPWTAGASFTHLERGKKKQVSAGYTYWVVFVVLHWKTRFPWKVDTCSTSIPSVCYGEWNQRKNIVRQATPGCLCFWSYLLYFVSKVVDILDG